MLIVNVVACLVLFVCASWCIYSPKVKDGFFGRLFYSVVAISAFVIATRPWSGCGDASEASLHAGLACLALRQVALKVLGFASGFGVRH